VRHRYYGLGALDQLLEETGQACQTHVRIKNRFLQETVTGMGDRPFAKHKKPRAWGERRGGFLSFTREPVALPRGGPLGVYPRALEKPRVFGFRTKTSRDHYNTRRGAANCHGGGREELSALVGGWGDLGLGSNPTSGVLYPGCKPTT